MKLSTVAALALTTLSLGACMTIQERMDTWIGSTDAEMMSKWGAPDRQARAADGVRILTYKDRDHRRRVACKRTFTVDAQHRIVDASAQC
jgi:hypothetical protein